METNKYILKSGREVTEDELYHLVNFSLFVHPDKPFTFFRQIKGIKIPIEVFINYNMLNYWERARCQCGGRHLILSHRFFHHVNNRFSIEAEDI
ncbi:MAG: hypothetical protein UV52_C0018G0002 [Parcubacteria group bacterium GW2011_GWD1_42_9]|nr:MAG: hypothetical protein UV52_C0018G0002 [Parcubacteria group bacterium GW2011_GWD1_42_9]